MGQRYSKASSILNADGRGSQVGQVFACAVLEEAGYASKRDSPCFLFSPHNGSLGDFGATLVFFCLYHCPRRPLCSECA